MSVRDNAKTVMARLGACHATPLADIVETGVMTRREASMEPSFDGLLMAWCIPMIPAKQPGSPEFVDEHSAVERGRGRFWREGRER
jgi:hypothetical protein